MDDSFRLWQVNNEIIYQKSFCLLHVLTGWISTVTFRSSSIMEVPFIFSLGILIRSHNVVTIQSRLWELETTSLYNVSLVFNKNVMSQKTVHTHNTNHQIYSEPLLIINNFTAVMKTEFELKDVLWEIWNLKCIMGWVVHSPSALIKVCSSWVAL